MHATRNLKTSSKIIHSSTIDKQLNVGCHGTSHIHHKTLEGPNDVPDVSCRDEEGVPICIEIGRIGVNWYTSEDPVVSHSGVIAGYVRVTGDVEDTGVSSQWHWDVGGGIIDVSSTARYGEGCMSGWS